MRYYTVTLTLGETKRPRQREYKSREERDLAADRLFLKMRNLWDVAVVLSLDVNDDGTVTTTAKQGYSA